MTDLKKGQIVRSLAGRDQGSFLAVVEVKKESVLLCDGKERPLERPKRKNKKHVQQTNAHLTLRELSTNRALRRALRCYGGGCRP